jgi:uncharacterized protein (DUF1684 family)
VGVILRVLALLAFVALTGCSSGPGAPDESGYVAEITAERQAKDREFGAQSDPVPPERRETLLPLPYYPPDLSYSVPAVLRLAEERPIFEVPTSTGVIRRMQRVGVLEFTLDGKPMSLGAFVDEGTQRIDELFVPFADLTTGKETYPAGRYLYLQPTATGIYTIDFNKAFNPYCAYNDKYDCPYPPPSNRLKVEIRAGEKAPRT